MRQGCGQSFRAKLRRFKGEPVSRGTRRWIILVIRLQYSLYGTQPKINNHAMSAKDFEDYDAIVLSCGNETTLAGVAGDADPQVEIPTDKFVERGVITNWDDTERFMHRVLSDELRLNPEEHPLLLTTKTVCGQKPQNQRFTQLMFETFNTPAFFVAQESALACYASGRSTALILDIGHGTTSVSAHSEGYRLPSADVFHEFGGQDLIEHLQTILRVEGVCHDLSARDARTALVQSGFVSLDFERERRDLAPCETGLPFEHWHELAGGGGVPLNDARFRAPEWMFCQDDALYSRQERKICDFGTDLQGVHESLMRCVSKCNEDCRDDLWRNVFVCGGATLIPGFVERLEKELRAGLPAATLSRVVAPPDRKYAVWQGGSILASTTSFKHMWITKEEYDESGPSIVNRKCYL
jgi:Actin